jgi:membrane protein implicated in regulation of membrane protease activity
MTPRARDRPGAALGRALRWKPRTHLGVCIVAVTAGAIYFAGTSVYPAWSVTIRLVLALGIVGLSLMSGGRHLRERRRAQHWSATHPASAGSSRPIWW